MKNQGGYSNVFQESDTATAIVIIPVSFKAVQRGCDVFIELDEISTVKGFLQIDKAFYLVTL